MACDPGWYYSPTLETCLPQGAVDLRNSTNNTAQKASEGKKDKRAWWEILLDKSPDIISSAGDVISATKGNSAKPIPNQWEYNVPQAQPNVAKGMGLEVETKLFMVVAGILILVAGFFAIKAKQKK